MFLVLLWEGAMVPITMFSHEVPSVVGVQLCWLFLQRHNRTLGYSISSHGRLQKRKDRFKNGVNAPVKYYDLNKSACWSYQVR